MHSTNSDGNSYPEDSARRLLGDAAGVRHEFTNERAKAAHALLSQFASLAKEYGFRVRLEDGDALRILSTAQETYILVRNNPGWIFIATADGKDTPIELNYDPKAKNFEGTEVDPDIEPEPGKLRPRTSALAVLAKELIRLSKQND